MSNIKSLGSGTNLNVKPATSMASASTRRISMSRHRLSITDGGTSRIRLRRSSYGFREISGAKLADGPRGSMIAVEFKRPPLIFLNTYQLEPIIKFNTETVEKMMNEVLDEKFDGHIYNAQTTPTLALQISGDMMRRAKHMYFNRYRIICVVTIGQKRAQSYNNAVTLLWDPVRDDYVDLQRQTHTAFIQVTLFGIYLD